MKAKGERRKAKTPIQRSEPSSRNFLQRCLLPAAFSLFFLSACGYRFVGQGEGFPKDVRTVYIEPFVNKSRAVGIESEIASVLRSEFHRHGLLRPAGRPDEADAILSGVVRSLESRVVAVNRNDEVLQFELEMVVDMALRRRTPDELIWRATAARVAETYSGSRGAVVITSSDFKTRTLGPLDVRRFTDVQVTESLRQEARERLVERLARDLHQRLMEMF